MTIIPETLSQFQSSVGKRFNWDYFLQDNITGSPLLMIWVVVLTLVTAFYTVKQMAVAPVSTTIILILVAIGVALVIAGELFQRHTAIGDWLKNNALNSIANTLLTLLMLLLLVAAARGFLNYSYFEATFDSTATAPEFRDGEGATWGVIWGAKDLLLYGRLDRDHVPRVQTAVVFLLVLSAISFGSNKMGLWDRHKWLRQILTYLWLLSPIVLFILLNGIPAGEPGDPFIDISTLISGTVVVTALYLFLVWQKVVKHSLVSIIVAVAAWPIAYVIWRAIGSSGAFPPINVDTWGGLLLTMIIAISVILLSFPLGMILALGRRSDVKGIPGWIIWPVAIVLALWGFSTTPQLLAEARNSFETLIAFWPALILGTAYALQHYFKGNVVAAATTTFIEVVRGVPLITLLFMSIIMAPFFFVGGAPIKAPYAVIAGYTIFASAYMAELIRGGLQAIPRGQFEAADAIGLNTLQKMRFIVLPQALRILIPALVGAFIGNFKSSSLVSVVGLFDLVGITVAIIGNPNWLGLKKELYFGMAAFYFIVSFVMSAYSRRLEIKARTG